MFASKFYVGVVEDRNDPEKLGRCRVRIFGIHSESKMLLPTRDLPWAVPLLPVTSGSISGIGVSPTGIVPGSWVVLIMLDGDECQQPMILGTILSKSGQDVNTVTRPKPQTININDGVVKTESGEPLKDSDGYPVRFGIPKKEGWYLGKTSEHYESGGRGAGTINDYSGRASGDYGGASYGMFQFASFLPPNNKRPNATRSPVKAFIASSKYADSFEGLEPATPAFDAKWKELSKNKDFEDEQREYIKKNYYDVALSSIRRHGIDLSKYGPAVQDLIWSSAVQLGPGNMGIYKFPLQGKSELDDKSIVELVMDYKIANVDNLFRSSSQGIRDGVRNRWIQEKQDLLNLIA